MAEPINDKDELFKPTKPFRGGCYDVFLDGRLWTLNEEDTHWRGDNWRQMVRRAICRRACKLGLEARCQYLDNGQLAVWSRKRGEKVEQPIEEPALKGMRRGVSRA